MRTSKCRIASLIGAPTDVGASDRGASMGPEALRVAGLHAALTRRGLAVVDRGNVSGPANPESRPVDGYRNLAEVVAWNRVVHEAVFRELSEDRLPILLGGDHSLSLGSISAVARRCRELEKPLRIFWLDAHADFNTRELTPSGSLHGMPLACLCGFGPPELLEIGAATPAIRPQWVRQIGIRSVDTGERRFVHEQALEVFDMRCIDELGVRRTMEQALRDVDANTHLHVSFDVDFLDPEIAPVTAALGILGMPGMTAYFGFLEICKPKAGETVVVSGAAGAVGSAVGQIAKIHGCHVVGIAGTDDKIKHIIEDLGFDAAFNYKTAGKYATKLKELCPNGIDCYFDNVGGEISDAVFTQMNTFGRVSVCGLISQYNIEKPEPGPRLLPQILVRQLHVEGFIVTRFAGRFAEGYKQMAQWLKQGKLKYREEFMTGFENTPKAFIAMLEGRNTGKMLVDCR